MITDELIETEISARFLDGRIIPLDYHSKEWITAGLYSQTFVNAFLNESYAIGETIKYNWTIRKQDQLINLRIWKK